MKNHGELSLYINYYRPQAGNGPSSVQGIPVMYGVSVGGIFHNLFRKSVLLLKRGLKIVISHVKSAAQGIARNMFGCVSTAVLDKLETLANQEGAGLACIKRKSIKRKRAMSHP